MILNCTLGPFFILRIPAALPDANMCACVYVCPKVFICGMPHEFDEALVREYWGYCGEIAALDMLVFPDTGNFNGVMFITFATEVRCGAGCGGGCGEGVVRGNRATVVRVAG